MQLSLRHKFLWWRVFVIAPKVEHLFHHLVMLCIEWSNPFKSCETCEVKQWRSSSEEAKTEEAETS